VQPELKISCHQDGFPKDRTCSACGEMMPPGHAKVTVSKENVTCLAEQFKLHVEEKHREKPKMSSAEDF
jgi:ribosomal protein L24E